MFPFRIVWRFAPHPMNIRRFGLPRILWHDQTNAAMEVSLSLVFEPRDLWLGLYWDRPEVGRLVLYLCLIPMLPLRVACTRSPGGRHW